MGRQWIWALGLGKFHKESNAFHSFCRKQDVEGRVKAGVANGFELQREMEQALVCSTERGRQRHADPAGRGKPQARKEEGCWYGLKRARATSQDQEGGNRREGWRAGRALDMAHGLAEALGSMMQYYRSGRLRTWRSFKEACCQYTFPGSHQVTVDLPPLFACMRAASPAM
eukprot:scaffold28236_cov59-Phaeocystis_antarctica.AAC.7